MTIKITKGQPADPRLRHELSTVVAELGDETVAGEIGISANTLARILAGLTVYGSTLAATRAYLERRKHAA